VRDFASPLIDVDAGPLRLATQRILDLREHLSTPLSTRDGATLESRFDRTIAHRIFPTRTPLPLYGRTASGCGWSPARERFACHDDLHEHRLWSAAATTVRRIRLDGRTPRIRSAGYIARCRQYAHDDAKQTPSRTRFVPLISCSDIVFPLCSPQNVFRSTSGLQGAGSLSTPFVFGGVVADKHGGVYLLDSTTTELRKWLLDGSPSGGTNIFRIMTTSNPTVMAVAYALGALASVPGHGELIYTNNANQLMLVTTVTAITSVTDRSPQLITLPSASLLDNPSAMQYFPPTNTLYALNHPLPGALVKFQFSSASLLTVTSQTLMFTNNIFGQRKEATVHAGEVVQ
jgi:hypothetical protein